LITRDPLVTDLYQLTMAQAYRSLGMNQTAVFELFVRRLPRERNFLVCAGLEAALDFLTQFRFTQRDCEYLESLGIFSRDFLEYLPTLRFTGTVHAMAEGTIAFAEEPLLRVTAPLIEAQLVESRLLNLIHYQTLVASKAARCVIAARGRGLVDFGMRRAHGAEAAVLAARASYLAGFDATATVAAGRDYGIPVSGTIAHSFVQAHDDERSAFRHAAELLRPTATLLIDTYDPLRAAQHVVRLAQELRATRGTNSIRAVRIDSGDLTTVSRRVREILDAGDCHQVQIVASGNVDEWRIAECVQHGAPIDAYGVGTRVVVSEDAASLDIAYKLQEYAGRPRRKLSTGKTTWPGCKQVWREFDSDGLLLRDRIALDAESGSGTALLYEVMSRGARASPTIPLAVVREHCAKQLERLPPVLRSLTAAERYRVNLSPGIQALAHAVDAAVESAVRN
jgi:nicotinate phosphoribosyltransferase